MHRNREAHARAVMPPPQPTTTRRGIFASGAAALLAGAGLAQQSVAATAETPAADHEILSLYHRWLAARDHADAISDRAMAIRSLLVDRRGEVPRGVMAADHWKGEPELPDLGRLIEESDRCRNLEVELSDEIFAIEAATPAGVLRKLQIALETQDAVDDETSIGVVMAIAAIEEAVRVLDAGQAGRR